MAVDLALSGGIGVAIAALARVIKNKKDGEKQG